MGPFRHYFNGVTVVLFHASSDVITLVSDASQTGLGLVKHTQYAHAKWPQVVLNGQHDIAVLELYSIFVGIRLWNSQLVGRRVQVYIDNKVIVSALNKQSSRSSNIMDIIRPMDLLCMKHNIRLKAPHTWMFHTRLCSYVICYLVHS